MQIKKKKKQQRTKMMWQIACFTLISIADFYEDNAIFQHAT